MAVFVSEKNEVIVRCNKLVTKARIEEFLKLNNDWIESHLEKNQTSIDKTKPIREYESVYILGKTYPLVIADRNYFDGQTLYVKDIKYINKLLFKLYGESRLERVRSIAEQLNLQPANLSFKKYKSMWGCCNTKKQIVFSYATLMLSDYLFDYIAVHELCHLIYMDHSKQFKALLSKFLPDWSKRRKALKEYSFLLKIY